MDCNYNEKELHWNFYINLGDVTDLDELDELLCIDKNPYSKKNEDDEQNEENGGNGLRAKRVENKIKNISSIMEEINEQMNEKEKENQSESGIGNGMTNGMGNGMGNGTEKRTENENEKTKKEGEKNVIGEIIKAYIFCKNEKIKKSCNLCLMSWIASKECWSDCDNLLKNQYFQNLLEPLIFICKALKEKVTHHFYQIPIEMHTTFLNNFKKYVTIYKDKEIITTLLASVTSILLSKISSVYAHM